MFTTIAVIAAVIKWLLNLSLYTYTQCFYLFLVDVAILIVYVFAMIILFKKRRK